MRYKRAGLFLACMLLFAISAWPQSEPGATPASAPSQNPLKIALLKWYGANTTTNFAVGKQPRGVCFDGANIWVANYGSNTVTKLRPSDGALLGTFAVGTEPANVAFDGANIWATNYGSGDVTKLRASDGKVLGTYTVGGQPFGIGFDGANMWVGNAVGSAIVTKLSASDGKVLGTFPVNSVGYGVIFDGTYIWTTNDLGTVTRLSQTGAALAFSPSEPPERHTDWHLTGQIFGLPTAKRRERRSSYARAMGLY